MRPVAVARRRVRCHEPVHVALDDVVEQRRAADGERGRGEDDEHAPRRRAAAEQHGGEHGDEKQGDDARLGGPDVVHPRHSAASPPIRVMIRVPARIAAGAGRGGGMAGTSHERSLRPWPRRAAAAVAAAVLVAAALVLAGCESPSILRSEGSAGNEIVTLAIWIFGILAVVLITVWGLLVFVIVRGRRRPESEASQTKGNLKIEIVWTAIPAVIVTVLFVLTVYTTRQIDDAGSRRAVHRRRPPVVVGLPVQGAGLQGAQRGVRGPGPHHVDRCGVGRRHPLLLGAADGRQGRHDPRARQPHPLRAAQGRDVPGRVLRVLRRAARAHALPLRRRAAG